MNLPTGFVASSEAALPLHVIDRVRTPQWRAALPAPAQAWADAHAFDATPGTAIVLPGADGAAASALVAIGDALDPFSYAHAPRALPLRDWALATALDAAEHDALLLGWGLGSYHFGRYRAPLRAPANLVVDAWPDEVRDVLAACARVRDLVNTPTQHMGPDELERTVCEIAEAHGARIRVVSGDDLIDQNFPAIHAVGRASHRAPRLIRLDWGDAAHPHVAIVGKGVCFDTGGLNIKTGDGMRNMKKDMGGAAHAIALAELVMSRRLPLRISLLVPAVENAIGPNALRPGEVISTRLGVHVEIDNTDAEGRLILSDALTHAAEDTPALLIDFATLTGAARVALGPDLPALYSNDETRAATLLEASATTRDPLWRMPLWRPYWRYLASTVADFANSGPSRMAGSVTAALYLERFVPAQQPWLHMDTYAWNDADRPGKPAGGEAQGLRAVYAMLRSFAAKG
ncbi:leucyl aminopeptidase family protein [Lysobacter sp. TY2-98]|uniref:leucyl aminopeptidase family protein n=1 Tax=Lysobacter sp. TY2-98 TaxID=2290922 RepID=UPI000E20807F|nr:leucyl aminopeptidase family protein [Lysobacter sp. TY2-98]AXK72965.1 leucyl aminopeptidase family protein [Lysobacter sp. TY2-98]